MCPGLLFGPCSPLILCLPEDVSTSSSSTPVLTPILIPISAADLFPSTGADHIQDRLFSGWMTIAAAVGGRDMPLETVPDVAAVNRIRETIALVSDWSFLPAKVRCPHSSVFAFYNNCCSPLVLWFLLLTITFFSPHTCYFLWLVLPYRSKIRCGSVTRISSKPTLHCAPLLPSRRRWAVCCVYLHAFLANVCFLAGLSHCTHPEDETAGASSPAFAAYFAR